jgi:hypothetical protein
MCVGLLVLGAHVNGPQKGTQLGVSADTKRRIGDDLLLRGNVRITLVPSGEIITSNEATVTTFRDGTGRITIGGIVRLTF